MRQARSGRLLFSAIVVVMVAVVLGVVAFVRALPAEKPAPPPTVESAPTSALMAVAATSSASAAEVPDIVGSPLEEAAIVLEAAGFRVKVVEGPSAGDVVVQNPTAGTVADAGSVVELSLVAPVTQAAAKKEAPKKKSEKWVVCIDPGHQRKADTTPEPIGPGAKATKPSVSAGTTGVETNLPEYEVVLQIAVNLKARLEKAGVKVVMTRTTNDVNLSNSERARIANDAQADLFVRVHADGSPEADASGISTLFPANNRWTKPIVAESQAAAKIVHSSTIRETGAVNRGTRSRSDLTGFNYSTVPSILMETGFLSNSVEDRLLSSPHYQDKLAAGMARGIVQYLKQKGQ